MDLSRVQDRLLSFAVSAMMTSAVLATAPQPGVMTAASGPQPAQIITMIESARSAGFAGMKDMPAPATVAAPAAASAKPVAAKEALPITPAQVRKLHKLATGADSHKAPLPEAISQALGLGPEKTYSTFTADDDETKIRMQIYVLPSGYALGRRDASGAIRFFRVDADMKLISGITEADYKAPVLPLTTEEATPLWNADLTTWAGIADDLGN